MQRRDRLAGLLAVQCFGWDLLGNQQLEPVKQFRGGRLLLQTGHLTHTEKCFQSPLQQRLLDSRVVDINDLLHGFCFREADIVKKATPQKSIWQFLLVVAGDNNHRSMLGCNQLAGFVNIKLHAIEFLQQVIGKFNICLVDLIDQQNGSLFRLESLPQLTFHDVIANLMDPLITELRITQAGYGIILVQPLMGLGGRLDMPLIEWHSQCLCDFLCQHGLAGAWLPLDQEGATQGYSSIDCQIEVICCYIRICSVKSHNLSFRYLSLSLL